MAVLASASALRGEPVRSMDEFADLVRPQGPAAKEALDRFLTRLAVDLTNIIFIFDTQLIAISAQPTRRAPASSRVFRSARASRNARNASYFGRRRWHAKKTCTTSRTAQSQLPAVL